MSMAGPLRPTLMTKMRAALGGERDAAFLEALRAAGRVAYDELIVAERIRASGVSPWGAPAAIGSQNLATWNAFVLQTLGETFLDADYAAKPGTVGFVPPVTYDQAARWFAAVEGWVSRARQARVNPDYDISRELGLPGGLPPWAEVDPCPPEHLTAMLAAVRRSGSTSTWRSTRWSGGGFRTGAGRRSTGSSRWRSRRPRPPTTRSGCARGGTTRRCTS
jgi:hypothetical protein